MEHTAENGTHKLTLVAGQRRTMRETPPPLIESVEHIAGRIPSILQTTLELESLLPLFEQQLVQVLKFDSFHYEHTELAYHYETETARHHRCHYKLEMNGQYLGDLTLTRRQRFTDQQIELLEDILCLLVYPLRNCLMYRQAVQAALMDHVTGLGNRTAYERSLDREVDIAKRQITPLSLIVVDIDKFKNINDSFGHSIGDQALSMVADKITHTLRRSDIAFRYGGEEFVLILNNTDKAGAEEVAERLRKAIADARYQVANSDLSMTVSLGVAELKAEEFGYHLFKRADKAMYEAKKSGRNCVRAA
jgi:diguanylate cyclase (GGDEF)-like protein